MAAASSPRGALNREAFERLVVESIAIGHSMRDYAVLNMGKGEGNQKLVEQSFQPDPRDKHQRPPAVVVMTESKAYAKKHGDGDPYKELQIIKHIGQLTHYCKAGQCDQFACATMSSLIDNEAVRELQPRIEIMGNGGHAFVVVGRNSESDNNDPTTWGETCFVVDPWNQNRLESGHALSEPKYLNPTGEMSFKSLYDFQVDDWPLLEFLTAAPDSGSPSPVASAEAAASTPGDSGV